MVEIGHNRGLAPGCAEGSTRQSNGPTAEYLIAALNRHCVFEVDDEYAVAALIPHINVVAKVDPTGLIESKP